MRLVKAMSHRSLITGLSILLCVAVSACMDINPPVKLENSGGPLLHSIHLPFSRGIYGVGDTDSIAVYSVLATGDTIFVAPDSVHWRISPVSSALEVDSVGRLTAISTNTSIASNGLNLIVSYTLGEITKADTAKIFITNGRYDIETFRMTMPDSNRGGAMTLSLFVPGAVVPADYPQLSMEVKDANDSSPPQMNFVNHFDRFLTSAETGRRFSVIRVSITSTAVFPTGLHVRGNAPPGEYWIGLETYMYGRYLKDSVRFTQMASAEVYFLASAASTGITLTANATVIQPCAIAVIRNTSRDTVAIELPAADYDCAGDTSSPERIVIPPGVGRKIRTLGYAVGSTKEWKAFIGAASRNVIASGTVTVRLDD